MNPPQIPLSRSGLRALCLLLWIGGLCFALAGVLLLLREAVLQGAAALSAGILMAASGIGLYRLKRWGVVIFGLLAIVGSINHLSNTMLRYSDLSQADLGTALAAILTIVTAILIPLGLAYLTLLLWHRTV